MAALALTLVMFTLLTSSVQVDDDLVFVYSPVNFQTKLGEEATMECHLFSSGLHPNIEWTKDGQHLDVGRQMFMRTYKMSKNSSVTVSQLRISQVQMKDQGDYGCIGLTSARKITSNLGALSVSALPKHETSEKSYIIFYGVFGGFLLVLVTNGLIMGVYLLTRRRKRNDIESGYAVSQDFQKKNFLNAAKQQTDFDDIQEDKKCKEEKNELQNKEENVLKEQICVTLEEHCTEQPQTVTPVPDSQDEDSCKTVHIPMDVAFVFENIAKKNTERNVETCGILAGKLKENAFYLTHVITPKQRGTSDTCEMLNEYELFGVIDKLDLVIVGWIHTHPTQTAFLSSVDLHTQHSYQLMLREAVAIVVAPEYKQVGYFTITHPHGMNTIGCCTSRGFHEHPSQYPLFQLVTMEKDKEETQAKDDRLRKAQERWDEERKQRENMKESVHFSDDVSLSFPVMSEDELSSD